MQGLTFTIHENAPREDASFLEQGLREHGIAAVGSRGFQPVAIFAVDDTGERIGGIYGFINWTWLFVSLLWVAEDVRRKGVGAELLRRLEAAAIERGCLQAHVDTFSYQARPFYERYG